jgi:hypothetical protein
MLTKTGVGFTNKTDSFLAGREVAQRATEHLDSTEVDLVVTFCNGKHDPVQFLGGVRSVTGNAPVVGGAAVGVFTNTDLSYEEYEANAVVFKSDSIKFKVFAESNLDKGEFTTGLKLGEQIRLAASDSDKGLVVFYDTIKSRQPLLFNFATPLFKAIEQVVDPSLNCVGCGLVGDVQLMYSYQFFNDQVLQQHAVALLVSGKCQMHHIIMHGCKPASTYKTITRTEGPVIFEIDHRPALEVIDEMFPFDKKLSWDKYPLLLTLGLNRGNKFEEFNEEAYANRLCLAIDRDKKALTMFEPDLKAGDEVQLMHRSITLDYIKNGIDSLRRKSEGLKPVSYLYINCFGRAKPFGGGILEDADEIRKSIGPEVTFAGFYSGVEVAKVRNQMQALDWTGVLCLLSEAE